MKSLLTDPAHWRERAQEARTLAAQFSDETARRTMLDIATSYEYLAERAQHRVQVIDATKPK